MGFEEQEAKREKGFPERKQPLKRLGLRRAWEQAALKVSIHTHHLLSSGLVKPSLLTLPRDGEWSSGVAQQAAFWAAKVRSALSSVSATSHVWLLKLQQKGKEKKKKQILSGNSPISSG